MRKEQNFLLGHFFTLKNEEGSEWRYSTITLVSYIYYGYCIGKLLTHSCLIVLAFFFISLVRFIAQSTRIVLHVCVLIGTFFSRVCGLFFHALLKKTAWLSKPYHVEISIGTFKKLSFFILCSLFLLSPLVTLYALRDITIQKNEGEDHVHRGVALFFTGKTHLEQLDFKQAKEQFHASHEEFSKAQKILDRIPGLARALFMLIPIKEGKQLKIGSELLTLGNDGTEVAEKISDYAQKYVTENRSREPSELVKDIHGDLEQLKPRLEKIINTLVSLDGRSLPQEYQKSFSDFQYVLKGHTESIAEVSDMLSLFETLAGIQKEKRYLVIFQNDNEIRATGGFMGSFALVDVQNGTVKKMTIPSGGSYDLQGTFGVSRIPPFPLQRLIHEWHFQDANWFPDFPASAKKIEWFFTKADGPTVDGVIAVNASFTAKLLALTGPIEMPDYHKVLTSENVVSEIEKAVELEYDPKKTAPKQFLTDFIPLVFQKLSLNSQEHIKKILELVPSAIQQRDVQIFLNDTQQQNILKKYGIDGGLKNLDGDYLMLVNSNIGGRKTDGVMSQKVSYTVARDSHDAYRVTLSITREHHGEKNNFFTGVPNINFLRIYVPKGSVLLTAKGFASPLQNHIQNPPSYATVDDDLSRIQGTITYDKEHTIYSHEEMNKQVFSNFIETGVGQKSTVTLSYILPKDISRSLQKEYMLYIQKQSGVHGMDFSFHFDKLLGERLAWSNKHDIVEDDSVINWSIQSILKDEVLGLKFETGEK